MKQLGLFYSVRATRGASAGGGDVATSGFRALTGSARAQRGMAIAETAEAFHSGWIELADQVIARLASYGEPFSAEDVRRWAGDPVHPNAVGARFNAAARRGLIKRYGYVKAVRPERHANLMSLWVGK